MEFTGNMGVVADGTDVNVTNVASSSSSGESPPLLLFFIYMIPSNLCSHIPSSSSPPSSSPSSFFSSLLFSSPPFFSSPSPSLIRVRVSSPSPHAFQGEDDEQAHGPELYRPPPLAFPRQNQIISRTITIITCLSTTTHTLSHPSYHTLAISTPSPRISPVDLLSPSFICSPFF